MGKYFKYLIFIIFIFILSGCNKESSTDTNKTLPPVKVKVKKINYARVPNYLTLTGYVKSRKLANISPKINGYIKIIKFDIGDFVKKNQIVAIITNKETKDKFKALKAQLQSAKLGLKQAVEMDKINKKSYLQAKSNYQFALKTYRRFKNLLKSESITRQEYDKVLNKYELAKLELEKAKKLLNIGKLKILQAKKEVSALKNNLNSLKVILNYRFVKAPFSGVIVKKYVDAGNFINVGMPIIQIGSSDKEGIFYAPSKYFYKIRKGDIVKINSNQYKIIDKSPDVDKTTSQFILKVFLGKKGFINGEYLTGKLKIEESKVITINKKYIKKYQGLYFAFIAENHFVVKVALKLKELNNNKYQVISGLNAGDLLIVSPLSQLSDNQPCEY